MHARRSVMVHLVDDQQPVADMPDVSLIV